MSAEQSHDGFLSFSGSRRMRVHIRPIQPVAASAPLRMAEAEEPSPSRSGGVRPTAATPPTTHERRRRLRVAGRGPARRLDHELPKERRAVWSPFDRMALLRGIVLVTIVGGALWFEWAVIKAIVDYVASWL
jgi:hypothetical protein